MGVTAIKKVVNCSSTPLSIVNMANPDKPGNAARRLQPSQIATVDIWIPWCVSDVDFNERNRYVKLEGVGWDKPWYIWQQFSWKDGKDLVRASTLGRFVDGEAPIAGRSKVDGDHDCDLIISDNGIKLQDADSWEEPTVRVSDGNTVEFLVDGRDTLAEMEKAIREAKSSINLVQLKFEPEFRTSFPDGGPTRLIDLLLAAARRGVEVRILLDDVTGISHVAALDRTIGTEPRIWVRSIPLNAPQRLHAKALVVDHARALILGLPLSQDYWDTQDHATRDGAKRGADQIPKHSVSAKCTGPVVWDIENFFNQLWNTRDARNHGWQDQVPLPGKPAKTGDVSLSFARTVPPSDRAVPGVPQGETGIFVACTRAISAARSFIYLEQQYLSYPPILDSLNVQREAGRKVLLLINQNPDIPGYAAAQARKLVSQLGLGTMPPPLNLAAFALWSVAPPQRDGTVWISPCYVESKVAIVDEAWATVGTANFDGLSLLRAGEDSIYFGGIGWAEGRSLEINIELFSETAAYSRTFPKCDRIAALRNKLWGEHLGLSESEVAAKVASGSSLLQLWSDTAENNVAYLAAMAKGTATKLKMKGRILPFALNNTADGALIETPRAQLKKLGIDVDGQLKVLP